MQVEVAALEEEEALAAPEAVVVLASEEERKTRRFGFHFPVDFQLHITFKKTIFIVL